MKYNILFPTFVFFAYKVSLAQVQKDYTELESQVVYNLIPNLGDVQKIDHIVTVDFLSVTENYTMDVGLSFGNINMEFKDYDISESFYAFEDYYNIELNLNMNRNLPKNNFIAFSLSPKIASTLSEKLTSKDLIINASLIGVKKWNETKIFSYGIGHGTLFGKPSFYPILNYSNSIGVHWKYTLGFPESALQYTTNSMGLFKLNIQPYGEYVNNNIGIEGVKYSRLTLSSYKASLYYNYEMGNGFEINTGFGYYFNNEMEVSNAIEKQSMPMDNSFFVQFGLKLNVKSKIKNQNEKVSKI